MSNSMRKKFRRLILPQKQVAVPALENAPVKVALTNNPRYDTYYRHLVLMGHGTPLWLPAPNESRDMSYRRRGAAIGDVIYFTPNGGLDFLFNICLDAHDPINDNNVPEGFAPFRPELMDRDMRRFQEYGEASYLASKSITKQRDRIGPAGLVFKSSASEGAILTMPEGAYSEDLARVSGFDRYLAANLDSWYSYINDVREWGVAMGELHLITGVHKAKAWGIATFSNERTMAHVDQDLQMRFKPNEDISSGDLYSWEYEGVVDSTKSGPSREERDVLFAGLDEDQPRQSFRNQCLFVRTVNAATRTPKADRNSSSIGVPTQKNNFADFSSNNLHSPPSSSSQRQGNDSEVHAPFSGSSNQQYDLSIVRNGPVLRNHPSRAINDFLLKEKPNSRIVITHDHHWISLLTAADVTLPSEDEFVLRLKRSFEIIENEQGVITLERKDVQSATGSHNVVYATRNLSVPDDSGSDSDSTDEHVSRAPGTSARDVSPIIIIPPTQASIASPRMPHIQMPHLSHPEHRIGSPGIIVSDPPIITIPTTYREGREDKDMGRDVSVFMNTPPLSRWGIHRPIPRIPLSVSLREEFDRKEVNDLAAKTNNFGSALYAMAAEGNEAIVRMMVEHGADVNEQGGKYGSALHIAAAKGHSEVVKVLIDKGAYVNGEAGIYGSALCAAVAEGTEATVKLLMEHGANINFGGGTQGSALYIAAANGNQAIVKMLINNGADVHIYGGRYKSPLGAAVTKGNQAIAKLLLAKGADVNGLRRDEYSAIIIAVAKENEEMTRMLIENGADVNIGGTSYGSPLQIAVARGNEAMVKLLIDSGADVNRWEGMRGNALCTAVSEGNRMIVKWLIEKGANINAESGADGNALQLATLKGDVETVKLLIQHGANVNQGRHYSALYIASIGGYEAIVKLLVENGADVNWRGYYCSIPLAAVWGGNEAVVKFLIEHGLDVNGLNKNSGTPLQNAASTGNEAIVKLLVEKGADVNLLGGEFGSALQAAAAGTNEAITEFLVEKGANVNALDGHFGTALQAAANTGNEAIVRLLVENGADVNLQGGEFGSALQAAIAGKRYNIVQFLEEKGAEKPDVKIEVSRTSREGSSRTRRR